MNGKRFRVGKREHAGGASDDAEIDERLERIERIGIEFAFVKNPR